MSSSPRISFLVPRLSAPVIGPVTVIAKILQRHHPVQIIGPDLGEGVCPMYRGSFNYTGVSTPKIYRFPDYFRESRKVAEAITGDIIFAVKAFMETVPIALREKQLNGRKVVVYLDEWDGAIWQQYSFAKKFGQLIRHAHHPTSELYYSSVERMIPRADEVVSTTTWLQRRFGGRILHMGVDTKVFKPIPDKKRKALKEQLGLGGKKLSVFGGVVRPHKGIEQILDALVELENPEVGLLLVGPETEHLKALQADPAYAPYLHTAGTQPKERMPEFLALADFIVLPLKDTPLAQSQMPCKIFEAMSMAKPVIATDVADLAEVLDGAGHVVQAGDPAAIAEKIAALLDDPDAAAALGAAAREKVKANYSDKQTERELLDIVKSLAG